MIIDADCHISPIREGNRISYGTLLGRMDKSRVDKALIWLQPPYMRNITESNAYVYEAAKTHPDRFLGFGWADPNISLENALDEAKKCLYEYDLYGVKLNGAQNEYYIDDEAKTFPIIEEVARAGKMLAFHCGADRYTRTHPYQIAKIARRFPDTPILCVHMGGAGMPDLSRAAIELARDHSNVTLIGSAVGHVSVLNAIKILGAERVCFGSDTPFQFMRVCLAMYRALLGEEISADDMTLVMGGNMRRLFNV
jgi:predicted TIM-barrel fold metal-dependent hydrolase